MKLNRIYLSIVIVLSYFTISAQTIKSDSLNILFIGNSFTHMNDMPSIFSKIATEKGKKVHVEKNTQAGASFRVHTGRKDMFEKIQSRKWDYIVLQGFSNEFCHSNEYIDTASFPYINQIIDSIIANNPCTNLLLYNTWGYKNGKLEVESPISYTQMQDSIISGYKYFSDCYNIPIVPVGMAWKLVRQNHPEINLYDEDNKHPNKTGSYLSACTFYASIFKESPEGVHTSSISNDNAVIIQKSVAEVVLKNFKEFKLDMNTSSIKSYRTSKVQYMAECKANYPSAKSITWDFGDGKTSKEKTCTHPYSKAGTYSVKLTVEDACGTRTFVQKVIFSAPKKPKKPTKSTPKTTSTTTKKI